jgi:hypothetical protein
MAQFSGLSTLSSTYGNTIAVIGALLSSGAVAWYFRSGQKVVIASKEAAEAKELAMAFSNKSTLLEVKMGALESRIDMQENLVQEIRQRLGKLDKVDELCISVNFIRETITNSFVPRSEHDKQWDADEGRFQRIEQDVKELRDSKNT